MLIPMRNTALYIVKSPEPAYLLRHSIEGPGKFSYPSMWSHDRFSMTSKMIVSMRSKCAAVWLTSFDRMVTPNPRLTAANPRGGIAAEHARSGPASAGFPVRPQGGAAARPGARQPWRTKEPV